MNKRVRGRALVERRQLEAETAEILKLKGEVGRGIYELGRLLDRIWREESWAAGGYESFVVYLTEAVDVSRSSAFRFMRVARSFNAQIANRYGVVKLEAAIRYLEETPAEEQAGDLMATMIRIRGEKGRYELLSLHEATALQIDAARKLVKDAKSSGRRIPRKVRLRYEEIDRVLPAAPRGTRSGKRVRVLKGDDGRLALSFQAIPADGLVEFAESLLAFEQQQGAEQQEADS